MVVLLLYWIIKMYYVKYNLTDIDGPTTIPVADY